MCLPPFVLYTVGLKREKQSGRHMVLIACDDGALVLKQRIERGLRDGDLTVVKDHHPKVFNGGGWFP